ncbi:MAG: hypothetical protein PWP51_1901 [Clostridiales bacterium]|nr:hypothetical protein [Clostridiales bacterium]
MTFDMIEEVLGFELPASTRRYKWLNEKTHSYAMGWLNAGFLVDECNLETQTVRFTYKPSEVAAILTRVYDEERTTRSRSKKFVKVVDTIAKPSETEIVNYLDRWDHVEQYRLQEKALNQLFGETYPHNTALHEVLVKVAALNQFYSTNIFKVFDVAKHIMTLNIDARLSTKDVNIVNEIATVSYENGKMRNFYSFATKYCSHHYPDDYPIYDSYVEKMLLFFKEKDQFCQFKTQELHEYERFKSILCQFRCFYGLENVSLKKIDQYLWQVGKIHFPNKY